MRFLLVSLVFALLCTGCTSDKEEAEKQLKSGKDKLLNSDFQGALKDLDKSIELNPDIDQAWFYRANVKMNLRDYQGSINDFNTCLKLNPYFTDAWVNRGNVKFIQGDRNGACEDWMKAKELGKENIAERLLNCS